MNVKRMLLLAGMALAAIAFAAPATAQATGQMTGVFVGQGVTATGINLTTTTSNGTLECKIVTLHYDMSTNGPNHVVLVPDEVHNTTTEGCVLNTGAIKLAIHITNARFGQLTISTWGTGLAPVTFEFNVTAVGLHCALSGFVPLQATNGTDLVHVETGNKLTIGGSNCPATGEMHGKFTLEPSGGSLTSDFVSTL